MSDGAWPKYVFPRGNKLWVSVRVAADKWRNIPSPYFVADDEQGAKAAAFREQVQIAMGAGADAATAAGNTKGRTFQSYAETEVERRKKIGIASWRNDVSRLKTHVYSEIGAMRLHEIRPRHIVGIVDKVREKQRAPRTVRNVYSIISAIFRRARIEELVDATPCILTAQELGPIHDGDHDWRADAMYPREELEGLISDPRIPQDRRVFYALVFLGMMRHGEAAGLRWSKYDATLKPLGRLVISTSYDTGQTKTRVERWMPVHQVLAAMLAEWRLSGWAREFERPPAPDDLIVPYTKPTNRGPRVVFGGIRSDHFTYKRMRKDCELLGFKKRRTHDTRHTGISLARDGGADRDILRRCTHKPSRDIIEQYTRIGWEKLCEQVLCLKVKRAKPRVSRG